MSNENIMPVRHGLISGTATTAAETGKGALQGMVKGGLIGIAVMAGLGALVFGGAAFGITLAATTGLSALTVGAITGGAVLVGALSGGVAGIFSGGPLAAGIGTVFGTVFGVKRGVDKVGNELGAATMLDAQLAAYQAQAYAAQQATTIYAPSAANNNNFPSMHQAGSRIQADTAQNLGTINGMQLQRA